MKKQIIYGIRAVIEAIQAGKEIDKIFIRNNLKGDLISELFSLLRKENIPYQYVPSEKINRLAPNNNQGVVAFISMISYTNIENLIPLLYEQGKNPFLLILDQISDVRNFGAIARTAEGAGVDAIIIPTKGNAQINADAIKTSAGALHKINVCRTNSLKQTIHFLQQSGIKIISVTEKASDLYYKKDFTSPLALIMGSEDVGISNDLLRISDELVKIPMLGKIESLNVSVATAIVLYEAVKQRF